MPRVVATPLRALLVATRLLGHALGRAAHDTTSQAQTIAELRLTCAQLAQQDALLRARLGRVPARHRPHYAPDERWQLLELRALHGWSHTAAHALVTPATVARWERDAHVATNSTAPTPARPMPPVRRFADVVRHLVQTMDRAGVGGNALIARTLARSEPRVAVGSDDDSWPGWRRILLARARVRCLRAVPARVGQYPATPISGLARPRSAVTGQDQFPLR